MEGFSLPFFSLLLENLSSSFFPGTHSFPSPFPFPPPPALKASSYLREGDIGKLLKGERKGGREDGTHSGSG